MQKLSRSALAALAVVIAVPATIAIAKSVEHGRWHNMSPETRTRLDEGRLAMAKTALRLTADQEKLWAPLETQVRDVFKDRAEKYAERQKMREERKADGADDKRADLSERFDKMSQNMSERAERMKAFAAAFKPFYASLSDAQKDVLKPLVRDLAPGFGGRGHKGGRWAHGGGWGKDGGGHHGWRGGHHRGERGGMEMDDKDTGGGDDQPERGGQPEGGDAKPAEKL